MTDVNYGFASEGESRHAAISGEICQETQKQAASTFELSEWSCTAKLLQLWETAAAASDLPEALPEIFFCLKK